MGASDSKLSASDVRSHTRRNKKNHLSRTLSAKIPAENHAKSLETPFGYSASVKIGIENLNGHEISLETLRNPVKRPLETLKICENTPERVTQPLKITQNGALKTLTLTPENTIETLTKQLETLTCSENSTENYNACERGIENGPGGGKTLERQETIENYSSCDGSIITLDEEPMALDSVKSLETMHSVEDANNDEERKPLWMHLAEEEEERVNVDIFDSETLSNFRAAMNADDEKRLSNEKNVCSSSPYSALELSNEKNVCSSSPYSALELSNEKIVCSSFPYSGLDSSYENNICSSSPYSGLDSSYENNICSSSPYSGLDLSGCSSFARPINKSLQWLLNDEEFVDQKLASPPGGEHRVVVYFTSLRAIRKTYENCCHVRLILQGFRVFVDERDVSLHSEYKKELQRLLGSRCVEVPTLFVRGQLIGGADMVVQLHEEGELEKHFEGFPVLTCFRVCEGCGDLRFVVCPNCHGSRRLYCDYGEIEKCPDCNENGLVRCSVCY